MRVRSGLGPSTQAPEHRLSGVLHVGWVPDGTGGYRGQLAVYVRPNGLLGTGYMAAIRPFRHVIVYPQMLRQIGRALRAGAPADHHP